MSGRVAWRSAQVVAFAAAIGAVASAQPGVDPDDPAPAPTGPEVAGPTEPPRPVVAADTVPDLPATLPDRFAVMPFENHTAHANLDYLIAGAPFALAEKLEDAVGLVPAFGPLIVAPPVVPGMAKTVAPFAAAHDARWVFTGWFERPQWELRLVVEMWKVEAGVATEVAQAERTGPFADVHRLLGEMIAELAPRAGWTIPDAGRAALDATLGRDTYTFTLFGRGLGKLTGVLGGAPDVKAALKDLEHATFVDPTMVEAQRVLGELLATSPEPRVAARATGKFNYAIDLRPTYAPALLAAATAARTAGKDDVALDLYRRLVTRRPWDTDARFRYGEALWKTGDSRAAVSQLEAIAARRPDDLPARRMLALIHAARGETEQLIAELEQIARRAPGDVEVELDLAGAYAALSRWEPALAAYRQVAAARPGDVGLAKRLGDVERWKGDLAASDDWYRRARELAPDDPRAYYAAAASQLDRGQLAAAQRLLVSAQRFKEYLGPTYHALGVVHYRLGEADEAAWYLRRAARLQPRKVATRIAVILAELARDDLPTAQRQLAFAAAAWKDDADLAYLAGVIAARGGDRARAHAAIERALVLDPGHGPARTALATLDLGGVVKVELAPTLTLPFGDARALASAIDRFHSVDGNLAVLRTQVQQLGLAILARFGEGPIKVRIKGQPAPRRMGCPIADVVRPWQAAEGALATYAEVGLELEELHRYLARHDALGDGANLLPDQRTRLIAARRAYQLDLADVRELRAMWTTAVGRELKAHLCTPALLAAAAADPARYTVRIQPDEVAPAQTRKPRVPRRQTFFVDNRECPESITVYVDGEQTGVVPGGERAALAADAGQRTLCLIGKGTGACGDRGTVRQAYMHDGWEVVMKCPK